MRDTYAFARLNGKKVIVYQGDITKEEVDAIVMPISSDQFYENIQFVTPVNLGDVVLRQADVFPCKLFLNVIGFTEEGEEANFDVSSLRKIIFKSLALASKHHAKKIAMSAIGPGLNGMSVKVCAETTLDVVEEFLRGSVESIQEVRFINEDKIISYAFKDELVTRHQKDRYKYTLHIRYK